MLPTPLLDQFDAIHTDPTLSHEEKHLRSATMKASGIAALASQAGTAGRGYSVVVGGRTITITLSSITSVNQHLKIMIGTVYVDGVVATIDPDLTITNPPILHPHPNGNVVRAGKTFMYDPVETIKQVVAEDVALQLGIA